MPKDRRLIYRIEVRAERGADENRSIRGLRWLLKRLGRNYHMTCVKLEQVDSIDPDEADEPNL